MERTYETALSFKGDDYIFIASAIKKICEVECQLCNGKGHLITTCSSKKRLDRMFNNMNLKIAWGKVKSSIISKNVDAAILTKETVNDHLKNLRMKNQQFIHEQFMTARKEILDANRLKMDGPEETNNQQGNQNQNQNPPTQNYVVQNQNGPAMRVENQNN